LFARGGSEASLGTGGTLGGSQIGGRIGYRINEDVARPLSIVARAYGPVNRRSESEAALGLEWKPIASLPVRVLAERRQAIGSEGRSAFSLLAYGGLSEARVAGKALVDAYAQAGVVGMKSRDLFADGSVAISLPVEQVPGLSLGGGVWGAVQPGVSRLDVGPRLSLKLPGAEGVRLDADWRFRVGGQAAPASGPSVTLAADF
jgi:hypothetical protein